MNYYFLNQAYLSVIFLQTFYSKVGIKSVRNVYYFVGFSCGTHVCLRALSDTKKHRHWSRPFNRQIVVLAFVKSTTCVTRFVEMSPPAGNSAAPKDTGWAWVTVVGERMKYIALCYYMNFFLYTLLISRLLTSCSLSIIQFLHWFQSRALLLRYA